MVVFDLDRFSLETQSTAKTIVTRLSDFSDLLELNGNYRELPRTVAVGPAD